jgi:fatty acid desaturase
MKRQAFGERMKIHLGITGAPAASAEDVMREARSSTGGRRKVRVARRARWWWVTLILGLAILLIATTAVRGTVQVVVWTVAGALLVLVGIIEGYLHLRVFAKEEVSPH